jgi:GNAT superfamily N-acetyltransferase
MNFPPGLTLRNAAFDDAQAVIELVNAAEVVDVGEEILELSDIEADWASPQLHLAQDVLLVEDTGRLVAWAQVGDERADANVHPDYRGRGIGLAIIEWTELRALEQAAEDIEVRLGQTVPEKMVGIRELFEARGYLRLWDSWVLRLPPEAELATPSLPSGVTIRPFRPGEEVAVYQVIDDAFTEWEGRESRPFEEWQARTLQRPDFDPALLLVAVAGDEPIGACHGVPYTTEGWLNQIAVEPSHRGQGIATALLATLFAEFRARGQHRLGLNTDSRTGTLGLYLGLGMRVEQTFTRWSRVLRDTAT